MSLISIQIRKKIPSIQKKSNKNYLLRATSVAGQVVEEGPIDSRHVVDHGGGLEAEDLRRLPVPPLTGGGQGGQLSFCPHSEQWRLRKELGLLLCAWLVEFYSERGGRG